MDELLHDDLNRLFRRISDGDENAFGILFQRSVAALYPFILRLVKHHSAVEEVMQAAFLRLWLSRDKLADVEQPKAWLYKVVANECYTWLRKEARELHLRNTAGPADEADDNLTAELSLRETRRLIAEAVSHLPPRRRHIFVLSRQQGKTIPEIAAALGLSPNSVKNTLVLALRDIRAHLARHGKYIPAVLLLWC